MPRTFYETSDPTRLRAALESLDVYVDERDRKRWLPAAAFAVNALAYSTISSAAVAYSGISLPDAATTAVTATMGVPSTWNNGSLGVTLVVGNNAAGAGDVVFSVRICTAPEAAALSDTEVLAGATAAPAQNQVKLVAGTSTHAVDANDDLVLVRVQRTGGDAGDTLAGTLVLLGALVTYNPS